MITVSLLVEFQELWTLMTAKAPESPGRRSWVKFAGRGIVKEPNGPARTATELHLTILTILSITIQSLTYPGLVLKNELCSDHLFRTQLPNKQTKEDDGYAWILFHPGSPSLQNPVRGWYLPTSNLSHRPYSQRVHGPLNHVAGTAVSGDAVCARLQRECVPKDTILTMILTFSAKEMHLTSPEIETCRVLMFSIS